MCEDATAHQTRGRPLEFVRCNHVTGAERNAIASPGDIIGYTYWATKPDSLVS